MRLIDDDEPATPSPGGRGSRRGLRGELPPVFLEEKKAAVLRGWCEGLGAGTESGGCHTGIGDPPTE